MEITITKVKQDEVKEEESISFETEEKEDSSLEKGKTKTETEGKEGTVVKTYKVTYENGEESDREMIDEKVVEEAQNKVVKVGTKEKKQEVKATPTSTSSSSSTPSGGKEMTMEATAYGPDCAGCSGISATGMNLKNGSPKVIAVDPSVIPLGSRVWVEGYGEAIAGDTGGAIKGNIIDVLYPSEAQAASEWGRRTVKVKILN